MHAYGGAKVGMERSLASIAPEGWLPMAAAMLGTVDKPPMWASVGLRRVVGTTIDFRVLPPILSEREKLLMLSCWQQWDPTSVPGSALSQWLYIGGREPLRGWEGRVCFTLFHLVCKFPGRVAWPGALACVWVLLVFGWLCSVFFCWFLSSREICFQSYSNSSCWPTMSRTCPAMQEKNALSQWLVGIDVEHGPDGLSSPTYLKQNFNVQEAADLYQAVHLHTLEDLAEHGPYPKVISQFALRIITYEYSWMPSLQFIFSRSQGICRTSSPTTSGMRRYGGMVTPRLEAESKHGVFWTLESWISRSASIYYSLNIYIYIYTYQIYINNVKQLIKANATLHVSSA